MNITMNVKSLKVTHLVPVSLSRFESTTVGNGVEVGDESDDLRSKDLTALSVRILLDGLSVDMDECDGRESIVIVCGYQSRCLSAQALKQCGCDNFTMCAYQIIRHPGLFLSVLPPRALVDIINNTLETKSWRRKNILT